MMPLIVEGNSKAITHSELRAIGFWMTVKGAVPVRPVRVFVSHEALADLDPSNIRDLAAAFEHFDRFRSRVEAAASDKFDRDGPDAEKYEGMPTRPIDQQRSDLDGFSPSGRARAQGEIEVNDFNRRQTDTGVLMLLKTSKLMAEYAARRLRL
jgi:hypothetical protein